MNEQTEVKTCNKCFETKLFKEFTFTNGKPVAICKPCVVIKNRAFYRTELGLVTQMVNNQKECSIGRNHDLPDYTKAELTAWLYSNNYLLIHSIWKESGYLKDLKPSVDRLDSTAKYSLANIRLVTWADNNDAAYKERKSGKRKTRQNTPISQFTEGGVFIKDYPSIANAARENKFCRTNINSCVRGAREIAHGYRWKYNDSLKVPNIPSKRDKEKANACNEKK